MNQLNIHIPEPCHEDFSKMKKDERGRYCLSCAKHVVDFSGKSTEEIIAFFETKKSGEVCGTFYPQQLENKPAAAQRKSLFQLRIFNWILAIVATNGFIACKVNKRTSGPVMIDKDSGGLKAHVDNITSVCPPGYATYGVADVMLGGSIVIRTDTDTVKKDTVIAVKKLPEDSVYMHFPLSGYILSEEDQQQLIRYAEKLKQSPSVIIDISGYADGTGSQLVNKKISRRRAEVVKEFLLKQGVTNPIRIHAHGKKNPIATNKTREGRAKNRRVELVIVNE